MFGVGLSGLILGSALANDFQDALAGIFDAVEDFIEAFRPTVVGVRNGGVFELIGKAHEQHQLVLINLWTLLLQCGKIFPVHNQNEVAIAEVVGSNLPRDAMREVVAALASSCLSARIGAFANVEAVGGGRVDPNDTGQTRLGNEMAEYTLGAGRATDITRANEKYLSHHG